MPAEDNNTLNLWHEQQLVGSLWINDLDRIGFRYDETWLQQTTAFPISLKLQLADGEFAPDERHAHRFFANLLPEGQARINIINSLKIANSDFALLRAIGGECAGAFNILPTTSEPKKTEDWQYVEFPEAELKKLILRRGKVIRHGDEKAEPVRLSLAGAQDKCPLLVKESKFFLPTNEAPTSHILKFQITDLRHVPAYETILMRLARSIGLEVAEIELKALGGAPANNPDESFVMIKRYDRVADGDGNVIKRLHQEDFCQALGFGYEKKYQNDGGPGFADCLNLLRNESSEPASDVQSLIHWQIFNLLAGNSDGHAKNLSILYSEDNAVRLAPFYDLVCTRAIERIASNLAFSIGGQYDPGHIDKKSWQQFAEDCEIGTPYLFNTIKEIAENILEKLPVEIKNFHESYGKYEALQRVKSVIERQIKRTLREIN